MNTAEVVNDSTHFYLDEFLDKVAPESPDALLLEVMSYGTWRDYRSIEEKLPEELRLNPNSMGERKLKMLTLCTFFENRNIASFEEIAGEIEVETLSELESVLCDAISKGFVNGQINQLTQIVECTRTKSRCIRNTKEDITKIINGIDAMQNKINNVVSQYSK